MGPQRSRVVLDEPTTSSARNAAHAFRATLDLFDAGLSLMRQNLRRSHPDASDDEIERRLGEWLADRPGAELGDCPGRPVDLSTRLPSGSQLQDRRDR